MSVIKENNEVNKYSRKDISKSLLDLKLEDEKTNKIDVDIDININNNRRPRRLHSTYISTRPQLFLEEKAERQNVIQWCLKVLEPISLIEYQKTSIFHRFCTAYDYIMEKLYILNKSIKEHDEIKILIISIFLLSYKMEGFSLAKLTISSLIDVFLTEIKIEKNEIINKIAGDEMKILEILDFNPQIFDDNNIHQLSYILYDLFFKKYALKYQ